MDEKTDGNAIKNPYIRIGAVAVFLAVLLFLFHGGRYSGLGTNLISAAFENGTIYGYDWILKLGFTVLTLAIGFQGGEVTPLFSIGASLGILAGNLLGISPVVCAALGYAAVFGSATNTLLAPVMIGLEVFGTENAIPLVVVCILAYLMNGGSSIYTAQQPGSPEAGWGERNRNLPGGQRIAGRSGPTGTEYGRKDERKKLVCGRKSGRV